jgi:hypothetical protein
MKETRQKMAAAEVFGVFHAALRRFARSEV